MDKFDNVIDGSARTISIKEILKYKDLITLFVKRNFTLMYKQTVLGPIWILLSPFITSIVFTFIFGQLAGISTDGTPQILFYMSGNCLWAILATSVNETSKTLVNNVGIFGKIYFPRLVMPISQVLTAIINFAIQFAMFSVLYIYFYITGSPISMNIYMLLVPVVICQISVLGFAVGIAVASLTIKYRDLAIAVGFGVQLWMYVTPIVYPYSSLGGITKIIVGINPATMPMEIFRYALMGSGTPDLKLWALSLALTGIFLFIGLMLFNKVERNFVDSI